eukprot:13924271-Alexandrium_andersonii.AAC.1
MSASLVGSEMCIRDSLPSARLGLTLARKRMVLGREACWRAECGARPGGGCLLYTSDAADDM